MRRQARKKSDETQGTILADALVTVDMLAYVRRRLEAPGRGIDMVAYERKRNVLAEEHKLHDCCSKRRVNKDIKVEQSMIFSPTTESNCFPIGIG